MGFQFRRRINLRSGWGINLSGSGASVSVRGRRGSVGTRGFSLRTGIPGLGYRKRWPKGAGALLFLAVVLVGLAMQGTVQLVRLLWLAVGWCALTGWEWVNHVRTRRV